MKILEFLKKEQRIAWQNNDMEKAEEIEIALSEISSIKADIALCKSLVNGLSKRLVNLEEKL